MKPEKKWPLRLNIQHFGNTDPADPPADPKGGQNEPPADPPAPNQAEIDRQISKAVQSALDKAQKRFEEEKQQAIADAKKDAEEYAKMSEKERKDAEFQKRLKEIEDRERALNEKQLLSEIESDLKEQALPLSFASALLRLGENEAIKEAITGIKADFDAAVNERVKEELRQETPGAGNARSQTYTRTGMAEKAAKHRLIK
ncbi:DUF4355 domain-containing protein [Edaphobacillus lindanitolerans]|uniref:DUF4355 domain-containing protein n=1 Tax=Edaphobacillus lindanitolerans TaxID=550447 RepID=A0A1U7PT83_9BACI|nr:DUF4355 domain-containing protein [Edaphobacillus lindanitolerans]SIT91667.1 protein of unknown function [Edaphobacillus lindanitolerans]